MTNEQVRKLLLRKAKAHAKRRGSTGVRAWCEHHGLTHSHVYEFIDGHRGPNTEMLEALGLEWRIARMPKRTI